MSIIYWLYFFAFEYDNSYNDFLNCLSIYCMDTNEAIAILRDYMHLWHELRHCDAILVMWSSDIGVAQRATELFHAWYARGIVCTWWLGKVTSDTFKMSESELFAEYMIDHGVPKDALILEMQSTNSGDNIKFWMHLLQQSWYEINTIIIVTKPYMERRAYATAKALFPNTEFLIASQTVSFETYHVPWVSQDQIINLLVGDFQRIVEYPKKWFQIEQAYSDREINAFDCLLKAGFSKYLL